MNDFTTHSEAVRIATQSLMRNERNNGREDVFREIEKAFNPQGTFKGRLYFDDVDDLIQTIKIRLQSKENNEQATNTSV